MPVSDRVLHQIHIAAAVIAESEIKPGMQMAHPERRQDRGDEIGRRGFTQGCIKHHLDDMADTAIGKESQFIARIGKAEAITIGGEEPPRMGGEGNHRRIQPVMPHGGPDQLTMARMHTVKITDGRSKRPVEIKRRCADLPMVALNTRRKIK